MKQKIFSMCALSVISMNQVFVHADQKPNTPVTETDPSQWQNLTRDEMRNRMITPPAGPKVDNFAMPFITADYIYWIAHEDNLGYGFQFYGDNSQSGFDIPHLPTSTIKHPKWRWGSGFKAGVGLNLSHDGWDTYVNYTRFHPGTAKGHITLTYPALTIIPLWNYIVQSVLTGTMTEAKESWRLALDALDAELGRNFYVSKYLTLRPFAGIKASWQEQKLKAVLVGSTFNVASASTNFFEFTNAMKQDFWGIGLRAGLEGTWFLWKQFGISSGIAFSGLWSQFNDVRKTFLVSAPLTDFPVAENIVKLKNNIHTLCPVVEWKMGLLWDIISSDDKFILGIHVDWEQQIWFDQNNFPHTLSIGQTDEEVRGGNLVLQGFTAGLRFDF